MKFLQRITLTLLTLTTFLTACGQAPNPTPARVFKTLGNLEVTLDTAGDASAKIINPQTRSSNPLPDNALSFTRKYSSSVDLDAINERYMSATFEVKNNSGAAINNMSLIAYNQGNSSIGGTAVKSLINFGGTVIADTSIAQSIYPVQSLKRNGADLVVDPDNADFQGFTPTDAESVGNTAKANQIIKAEDTPLEYGFIARNNTNTRTIGDGETGSVTLTLRFERPTNPIVTPYKFVMTFVIVEDSVPRVTRGINETTFEAETRASKASATELMLIGPDSDVPTDTSLTTVRLENAKIGLAPTYLVKPALFMKEVQPSTINNDVNNTVSIKGLKFDPSTSFFIQSTKLEILNLTETEALVTIPKGFIPSKYGIMAANNKGERATLYPAVTIDQGVAARELDVFDNPQSFVEGYVIDYVTKQPIEGAKVSIPGLETTTTSDGYYLLRGVPAGNHSIKIQKFGQVYNPTTSQYEEADNAYEMLFRNVNVPVGAVGTITLKLAALEPKTTGTYTIGADGGTVIAQDGAYLNIPPGALENPTPIRFTHLRAAETLPELNQDGNYLAFAHLEPTGLVFKKPATLFLPLQAGVELKLNTPINILYFNTLQNAWVDDITSGKISRINGRHYLEYEINHFTWIGGTWFNDSIKGCVADQDGNRVSEVTTNWGITDENGEFHGMATRSDVGRTLDAYAILPSGVPTAAVSATYNGNGDIAFTPCIVYQTAEPNINPLEVEVQKDTEAAPFATPSTPMTRGAPDNVVADCANANHQLCTTDNTPVLVGQKLKVISFDIKNFKSGQVQAKTLEFYYQGKQIAFEMKAVKGDTVRVFHILTEPQRPDGIERHAVLKFKYKKPDGTLAPKERDQSLRSIAQLKTPNVAVNVLPDAFLNETGVSTPYEVKVPQGKMWIFRASQLESDGSVTINAPVEALDANGAVIGDLDTINEIYFSDPSAAPKTGKPPSAAFHNGIATIALKIYPSTSPRSDDISRALLNQVSVAGGASGLSSRPVQTRVSTISQPFKVLPNSYSMIYSSEVAVKSPSAGAKSLSFWSGVGDWFTWGNISSAAGSVAQFALGFVPILGGAIDCGKGAYALIAQTDVDLVETELGCLGMSVDAIMTAAAIADACTTCPAYLGNKAIMIALKRVNQISRIAEGVLSKTIKYVVEKMIQVPILKIFEYSKGFIKQLDHLKFYKNALDAGEVVARSADNVLIDVFETCVKGLTPRSIRSTKAKKCDPDEIAELTGTLANRVFDSSSDVYSNFQGNADLIIKKFDASFKGLTGAFEPLHVGKMDQEEFLKVANELIDLPGADEAFLKFAQGNGPGPYTEFIAAKKLQESGHSSIEFARQFTFTDPLNPSGELLVADADVLSKLGEAEVLSSVKSLAKGDFTKKARAISEWLHEGQANGIARVGQFIILDADLITQGAWDTIKNANESIEIVDTLGEIIPRPL